jgi:serine protease inhibitor ecotin
MKLRQKKLQRINETESWFFKKINKIDQPLANLSRGRKGKKQIDKIRDVKGDITMNANEIWRIITEYFVTYIHINWRIWKK